MTTIKKPNETHAGLLARIGKTSFIESHGHSASWADISKYVDETYTEDIFAADLQQEKNIYHIIYSGENPAGYSKIVLNEEGPGIQLRNITKLERLYLLEEYHDQKLGLKLLQFNIDLSRQNGQAGMWLYTWKENHRAVNFYKRNGFEIIGGHDFKLTETHANPNHQMLLIY